LNRLSENPLGNEKPLRRDAEGASGERGFAWNLQSRDTSGDQCAARAVEFRLSKYSHVQKGVYSARHIMESQDPCEKYFR
jgi:hypothetical protein